MNCRFILHTILCLTSFGIYAQDVGGKTLVSQSRTTTANIGKCDITISYHSPSVQDRKIFGGIVPYDFVVDGVEYPWRAGSNQRTTIKFSHDVKIEGQYLPAGSYGFLVLVNRDEWTLIFSSSKSWGAFNYDKSNDVLRVPVKTKTLPFQEWLSYEYTNPTSESVGIQLRWEETGVTFQVSTDPLANILADLNKMEDKSAVDYQELAIRTLEQDAGQKDQALNYLEQSYALLDSIENEYYRKAYAFNYKVQKGELLISMGEKKEGKKLIREAFEVAQGYNMYYYALQKYTVEGEKESAVKALEAAIKQNPDNFQNHLAFGEIYLKKGNQQKATEHFKKAYEMTVEQKDRWENYARYLYLQNKLVLESLE